MKTVLFKAHYTPYAKGDIAGIDDKLAKYLVEEGIAEPYKGESKAEDKQESKSVDAPPVDKMASAAPTKK